MTLTYLAALAASCVLLPVPDPACWQQAVNGEPAPLAAPARVPQRTGEALDVVLTAQAAIVWDQTTGTILYAKAPDERRPTASLIKLLSALTLRQHLAPETLITIPPAVQQTQRLGAHIRLPVGEQAAVRDLLAAGLIASANDAIVALAVAAAGSEEAFLQLMHTQAAEAGLTSTVASNATGLSGGEQYSTARDMQRLFRLVYADPLLRNFLGQAGGQLMTSEGSRRVYESTNDLLGTYLPVVAAKTGYTVEAGENLVIMTTGPAGQEIGAVVLGSQQRFQDMKILIEWIWRNYTW